MNQWISVSDVSDVSDCSEQTSSTFTNGRWGNIWLLEVRATIKQERWIKGHHKLHKIQQRQISKLVHLGVQQQHATAAAPKMATGPWQMTCQHDNVCFTLGIQKVGTVLYSLQSRGNNCTWCHAIHILHSIPEKPVLAGCNTVFVLFQMLLVEKHRNAHRHNIRIVC